VLYLVSFVSLALLIYNIDNMTITKFNRAVILTSLLAIFIFLGAGCGKSEPKTSTIVFSDNVNEITDQDKNIDNQAKPKQQAEVSDPDVLAILLLTQGSNVIVTRGEEQTEGVHQMELYAGDEIYVQSGEAQLLYPEIGLSILSQGTKLTILPGKVEQTNDSSFSTWILLEAGKIWTRLEKVLGSNEGFSVENNNVVATVRGTAFGVSFEDGIINITVADNQVQVTSREALSSIARASEQAVVVSAGNSIKVKSTEVSSIATLRKILLSKLVKVSDTDKKDLYYRFGLKSLDLDTLKKPEQTFKWSAPINISQTLRDRLSPEQLDHLELIRDHQIKIRPELMQNETIMRETLMEPVRFQIPLREIMLSETTTTESPSADGPIIK